MCINVLLLCVSDMTRENEYQNLPAQTIMKTAIKKSEPNVKITAYIPASVKAKVENFGTETRRTLSLAIQYLVETHPETTEEEKKKFENAA